MASFGKFTMGIVLAILVMATLQPLARADGIPLTRTEYHGTLRENRQIAFVDVDGSAEYETLDLLLSVVSLDPGKNLTILIPLRTRPTSVSALETTEYHFRAERNYDGIMELADMQNHALGKLGEETLDNAGTIVRAQMTGIFGFMVYGMGAGDGAIHYELSDGVSMDLLSFNSTDSLSEYYLASGVEAPPGVEDMIERYGDFNVGAITAVTRPPVGEDQFNRIAQRCPAQLDDFRRFVAANPTITLYDNYGMYDMYYMGLGDYPELARMLDRIGDPQLQRDFSQLIYATYGMGMANGTAISFRLPLPDRTAFFPLGTTPAWNGVQETQVIFKVQDDKVIAFNKRGESVFHAGCHYYVWDFGAGSPDYDLEGRVKAAGLGASLNKLGRQWEQFVYMNAGSLGFSIASAFFISLWSGVIWLASKNKEWNMSGKKRIMTYLAMGAMCYFASFLLTVFIGALLAIVFIVSLDRRAGRWNMRHFVAGALGIMLVLTAVLFMVGIRLAADSSMGSLPFISGLFGVFFIFMYWIFGDRTDYERSLGAWFFYLATVAPSFLVTATGIGETFCTLSFAAFFMLQTFAYLQLIKIEEEPVQPVPQDGPHQV